jgi:hypothetical protein
LQAISESQEKVRRDLILFENTESLQSAPRREVFVQIDNENEPHEHERHQEVTQPVVDVDLLAWVNEPVWLSPNDLNLFGERPRHNEQDQYLDDKGWWEEEPLKHVVNFAMVFVVQVCFVVYLSTRWHDFDKRKGFAVVIPVRPHPLLRECRSDGNQEKSWVKPQRSLLGLIDIRWVVRV